MEMMGDDFTLNASFPSGSLLRAKTPILSAIVQAVLRPGVSLYSREYSPGRGSWTRTELS